MYFDILYNKKLALFLIEFLFQIRKTDVPERMQIREVPITAVEEGSTELEDEAEWIYKQAFLKPPVSKADTQEARERSRRYVHLLVNHMHVFVVLTRLWCDASHI